MFVAWIGRCVRPEQPIDATESSRDGCSFARFQLGGVRKQYHWTKASACGTEARIHPLATPTSSAVNEAQSAGLLKLRPSRAGFAHRTRKMTDRSSYTRVSIADLFHLDKRNKKI